MSSSRVNMSEHWREMARHMVGQAILAPSSHNTQPWIFRIGRSEIDLIADKARALLVNDPDNRELSMSCGAALMNLRIAAANREAGIQVERLPDNSEPDWIARAMMSDSVEPNGLGALADSVPLRRTYRKEFAHRELDDATISQLIDTAEMEGAQLRPLRTEEARLEAAALISEGDAAQWDDTHWRKELAASMHPRRRGDGLTVPALAAPITRMVVRMFDMGGGVGTKDRQLAEASPLLAVLCTEHDDVRTWIRAGEALQRVLLTACQCGLQASYLNQPIQVASLRPRLQDLVGGGFPQILLRFGYPTEAIPMAPRRPIEDVIETDKGDVE